MESLLTFTLPNLQLKMAMKRKEMKHPLFGCELLVSGMVHISDTDYCTNYLYDREALRVPTNKAAPTNYLQCVILDGSKCINHSFGNYDMNHGNPGYPPQSYPPKK